MANLEELWGNLSAAKIAYSIILLALIWLLGRELIRVWWDPQLYVGNFKYFKNGQPDPGLAEHFAASLLAQHFRLRGELEEEHRNRAEAKDRPEQILRTWPVAGESIERPPQVKPLELKINGFDVGGLLATLRGWISQPNEVEVTVQSRTFAGGAGKDVERVDTDITWPRAPRLGNDQRAALQHFNWWGSKDDDEAAALLAASLIWADAAKNNRRLHTVGRESFSNWAYAWLQYRSVTYEGATAGNLNPMQNEMIEAAGERIKPLLKDDAYPEIWRLAAELVTLSPGSISGGEAKDYWRRYFSALGIKEPAVARTGALEAASALPELLAGSLIFGPNRKSAVRFTAVVQDESGKRFLLLPDLVTAQEPLPANVYAPMLREEPVARVIRRIATRNISLALAEPTGSLAVSNGAVREVGALPNVGEMVRVIPGDETATITSIDASLPAVGGGLVKVGAKITQPGDAGAPVVDSAGRLVAMGYAADEKASYLVALHDLLAKEKLKLAGSP